MTEHDLQSACFDFVRLKELVDPRYQQIFAVPNGGQRHPVTAGKLKAEGVRKGVVDIIILCPSRQFHGAVIEMKMPGELPTPEQDSFILRSRKFGFYGAVCFTVDNFIKRVLWYFEETS